MFIGAGPRSVARVTTSFGLARSIGDLNSNHPPSVWQGHPGTSRSARLIAGCVTA